MSIQNQNNIYRFIVDFYKKSDLTDDEITLVNYTKLIENFLYKVFIQNLEKSKFIFDRTQNISNLVESLSFTNEEKNLINMFLNYDNNDKDKAIFNIGSWAIEFATINGNIELGSQLNNITHKTLYLDTNVLFRMIGVDGEHRKKRLISFLQRCVSCGQSLKVTKMVMDEYQQSIKTGINYLNRIPYNVKYLSPIRNSIVRHFSETNGISVDLYLAELQLDLTSHFEKLGIKIETYDYYKMANGTERRVIDECSKSIKTFKHHENEYQSLPDATNLMYIEKLRNNQSSNFNDSMYFFLTVDKNLTKWEQNHVNSCPITMRPSDWLTLLLKYVSRSSDDYKAFVNFIQTVIQTEEKDSETVLAMLEGISMIAEKLENQEELYATLVSQKYNDILNIDKYQDKVEFTRNLANSILEKELKDLKKEITMNNEASDDKMSDFNIELQKILSDKEKERKSAHDDRIEHIKYVRENEQKKVVLSCVIGGAFLIPTLIILITTWLFTVESWNMIFRFYLRNPDDTLTWQFGITGVCAAVIPLSGSVLWKNLIGEKTLKSRMIKSGIDIEEINSCKRIS